VEATPLISYNSVLLEKLKIRWICTLIKCENESCVNTTFKGEKWGLMIALDNIEKNKNFKVVTFKHFNDYVFENFEQIYF
jgi:hypothetical protein